MRRGVSYPQKQGNYPADLLLHGTLEATYPSTYLVQPVLSALQLNKLVKGDRHE